MDEFVTYVLYSEKYDKIYIGFSSALIERFYSHNYFSKKGYTLKYRPWSVLEVEFYKNKKEAMQREKFLKSGKGREFIYKVIFPKYRNIGFISA
jgi:putative endonuclease